MSTQLAIRVRVTEGTNDGPPVDSPKVTVVATAHGGPEGYVMMDTVYLTVEAAGFETYPPSPYAIASLAGVVPISLHRAANPVPPQPEPGPNPAHVTPGPPLSTSKARSVVMAAAEEFPGLLVAFPTDGEAIAADEEFLLRVIWHLQQVGFQAARQQNPSGAMSKDKLCILVDGGWHAYDIMSMGSADKTTTVQFLEVAPPRPVSDPGVAD